jgi:hypothetical protein
MNVLTMTKTLAITTALALALWVFAATPARAWPNGEPSDVCSCLQSCDQDYDNCASSAMSNHDSCESNCGCSNDNKDPDECSEDCDHQRDKDLHDCSKNEHECGEHCEHDND